MASGLLVGVGVGADAGADEEGWVAMVIIFGIGDRVMVMVSRTLKLGWGGGMPVFVAVVLMEKRVGECLGASETAFVVGLGEGGGPAGGDMVLCKGMLCWWERKMVW